MQEFVPSVVKEIMLISGGLIFAGNKERRNLRRIQWAENN